MAKPKIHPILRKFFARIGKQGGKARAKKLTRTRRIEIAEAAARARWGPAKKSA